MRLTKEYIGAMCHEFRRIKCKGITQQDVADAVGYSRESVNKFESGGNGNCAIFMWYIKNGLFDWVPIQNWNGWGFEMEE